MKRIIKGSTEQEFEVCVNFCGYIGADEYYTVNASSEDAAIDEALELAADELSVSDIEHIEEDEYEITVNFAGFVGIDETYTVYGNDVDSAEVAALEVARMDLGAEILVD